MDTDMIHSEHNNVEDMDFENENGDLVKMMTDDLIIGKRVFIGFCERQCEDTVNVLASFRDKYPEIILPLYENNYVGTGDLHFTLQNNIIKCDIHGDMEDEDQIYIKTINITMERFINFANDTKDFAVFINDNGNNALNI